MPEPLVVTWQNFRGFKKPTTLKFPQFTLLIGRNNVGKTSSYAPLLMLRQTLDANDPRTGLLSRGPLIDAGPFKDYVSGHKDDEEVKFTISLPEFSKIPGLRRERERRSPVERVELSFKSGEASAAFLQSFRVLQSGNKPLLSRHLKASGKEFDVKSELLPTGESVGRPYKEITELRKGMKNEFPRGFLFDGFGGLLVPASFRENSGRWEQVRGWYNAANDIYFLHQDINRNLYSTLQGLAYLGPLRSLPQRTYRLAAETPPDVGPTGEYAPELLFREQPDSPIRKQVDKWLATLGYGNLSFPPLGEDFFQVNVSSPAGVEINLAHSGTGLSQLLPLLVQGVTSARGATIITQQPEIHLNPAQQSLVTDFLVESSADRRVVVETHSEHILLRLRLLIAQQAISADDVAVYFFDNRDGRTTVESIPMGDAGEIDRATWPSGFFEEQLHDSFALALAQSRNSQVHSD